MGGYGVISALYDDPDALHELLPNDRLRMLARSMIEVRTWLFDGWSAAVTAGFPTLVI